MNTHPKRWVVLNMMVALLIGVAIIYNSHQPKIVSLPLLIVIDIPSNPLSFWHLTSPVTADEVSCLVTNIYFEARGDTIESQYAVADVVMHRVMHVDFPDTICGVVKQGVYPPWNAKVPYKNRCSFSWYCDRKSDTTHDKRALGIAEYIAQDVLFNVKYEPEVEYALYYHADYVNPDWGFELVAQVGQHLFYL